MPSFTPDLIALGFVWYIVFLFSTTCHEAAHALVAKIGGDPTAALGGQVSLNPIPHIRREPFGMVLIPVLAFIFTRSMIGWASAPYDPAWERRHPHRAGLMALAGPAANFTLMLIAGIIWRLNYTHGWFRDDPLTGASSFALSLIEVFFLLNLLLGTFNLLPFPPLDGSSVITLLMPERTALRYSDWVRESGFRMFGLIIAILLFNQVFGYIRAFAVHVLRYGLQ